MKLISQGAEGKIYEDSSVIIKVRESKSYRIPELDNKLIKARVKKEAKILTKLNDNNINAPRLIKIESNSIFMDKIEGKPLKEVLNDINYQDLMVEVGKIVAKLHNCNIVHGDLTTLNFIVNDRVYIIDFGLSFFSYKDEDKATDLYVFEKAIKCAHSESYVLSFFEGYSLEGSKDVLKKLESVRKRGRKREDNAFG